MAEATAATTTELEAVPSSWPGAFGAYKYSRNAIKFNLETVVWGILAWIGVYIVYGVLTEALNLPNVASGLLQYVIDAAVSVVQTIILLACVARVKISLGEAISKCWKYVLPMLLQTIAIFLLLALSIFALIIPFFFVLPRLMLAPYYLIDKDMGPIESIGASWNETKGYSLRIWGIILVSVLMALLCITIIGIPVAIYLLVMYSAAFAVIYAYIQNHKEQPQVTAAAPAAAPQA